MPEFDSADWWGWPFLLYLNHLLCWKKSAGTPATPEDYKNYYVHSSIHASLFAALILLEQTLSPLAV